MKRGLIRKNLLTVLVGLFLIATVLSFIAPSVGSRPATRKLQCLNNMKQITLALLNYESAHGSLPPAYTTDKQGKPLLSWRVLILPYLDYAALYKKFDLTQPWNSPQNRPLADLTMKVFQCPSEQEGQIGKTSYLAVVGDETAWPAPVARKLSEFTDAREFTILIVESKASGIYWSEPRDLSFEHMPLDINSRTGLGISSPHPQSAIVFFADGSGRSMSSSMSRADLRALLTATGREAISPDF